VVPVFPWKFLYAKTIVEFFWCRRSDLTGEMDRILKLLFARYESLRSRVRERWQRDLPFDELLFDRWERARTLGFGKGSSVYHNSYIYGDVQVGENTWIGPFTLLDGSGGLAIGSYCSISAGVQIYTHDTVKWALTGGRAAYERVPVVIGDCCYVGSQTVIAKGVTVGDHCVIGACSFVNRNIPPYSVAFGSPCRVVGRVDVDPSGKVATLLIHKKKSKNRFHKEAHRHSGI
jgi:acetyltransferase-like isoleucine patch superfamily enzyme